MSKRKSKRKYVGPEEFAAYVGTDVDVELAPGIWGRLNIWNVEMERTAFDSRYMITVQVKPV